MTPPRSNLCETGPDVPARSLEGRVLTVGFTPSGLLIICLFVQAWLVILHVHLARHANPGVAILGQAFDLMRESSLPTTWASLQAFAAAAVAALVAASYAREGVPRGEYAGWIWASALFVFIGIDDGVALHEKVGSITSLQLMTELGYPSYPWHIMIAPIIAGWLLLALCMLWGDLSRIRGGRPLVVLALACFGVSQGLDFVEGLERMSKELGVSLSASLPKMMIVEEVLEMVGTALFLCAFAMFLRQRLEGVTLVIQKAEPEASVKSNRAPRHGKEFS